MVMIINHGVHPSIQKSIRIQSTRSGRLHSLCMFKVHSNNPEGNSENSTTAGWTPFDHVQEESSSSRSSRMIETQRGEVEHISSTPKVQDCCEHCHGTGLVVCQFCKGTSRVNYVDKSTVPKGEWPMWCTTCIRCTGKTICGFCLGSGKKREPIGFRV